MTFKMISWDSVVILGIRLSNDCRLSGNHATDPRVGLAEALLRSRLVPMSTMSMGGRSWEANPVQFEYLKLLANKQQAEDRMSDMLSELRGYGEVVQESPAGFEWWEAILTFDSTSTEYLEWQSATSGAKIRVSKNGSGWTAVFVEGHKTSAYRRLFDEMSENSLTEEDIKSLLGWF